MPNSRVFLDIDLDSHRAKYARAAAFVEATDLRYGFSSKEIAELGGGEKQRVLELYADDFDWSDKGPIEIEPAEEERLVIELFDDKAPMAVENFKALCVGDRGVSKNCGVAYSYEGVRFHRAIAGFMAQGGDFAMQNGSGGESIWGKKFKDDQKGLKQKFSKRGLVAMGTHCTALITIHQTFASRSPSEKSFLRHALSQRESHRAGVQFERRQYWQELKHVSVLLHPGRSAEAEWEARHLW